MRLTSVKRLLWPALLASVASILTGCLGDDLYVDDDVPAWEEAVGLTGFFDATQKLTLCGNCHLDLQAEWQQTAHAHAWESLQESGHAQASCEPCHAVSSLGNYVTDPQVGWVATGDPKFQQVQCESCHGPGASHISAPEFVLPLASILAGTNASNGCGECHQGTHHPFVEQWEESGHATVFPEGDEPACAGCHEGRAALEETFGVDANYLERGSGESLAIVCAVCHDPHGSPLGGQLRASITERSDANLCVACHSRRGQPPSSHGPHAAQGLLLYGKDVGWIPPNFPWDPSTIVSSHGTSRNERQCVTCHMPAFSVTDDGTGDFVFQSVGHLFQAVACLDAEGIPQAGNCDPEDRDFAGCLGSGCHGTIEGTRIMYERLIYRLEDFLDEVWYDSNRNSVIDVGDGGVLPQVVALGDPEEFDFSDENVTVAEGMLWNAQLAHTDTRPWFADGTVFGNSFSAHPSSGNGVHNAELLKLLLYKSIQATIEEYGLQPSPHFLELGLSMPFAG